MTTPLSARPIVLRLMAVAALTLGLAGTVSAQTAPTLKVAALKSGTVSWELDTIRHHRLDAKHGFRLEMVELAGDAATKIAFQGGTADMMVSDWIWVARQRAAGRDYAALPYSKAVGGLLVPKTSTAASLSDLKGGKIGIAGGPLDKSWLLIQALARKQHGLDLAKEAEALFGAPPLIQQMALRGEMAAAINFWHFAARMEAAGMRRLVDVADAARSLGLDPDLPLLGYVFKGEMARADPALIAGFAAASREAKRLLAGSDAEWDRLRPAMNVADDAEFIALRDGFREGIPAEAAIDEAAACKLLALLAAVGGEALVGAASTLPEGVFYNAGS